MNTIHKFPLKITDAQTIPMPMGAQMLSVDLQKGQLMLWALVENTNPTVLRTVYIFGTGNPVDLKGTKRFLGTVQHYVNEYSLVWHVFADF